MTNIKNIVIWALVLVNAFFLSFCFWRIYQDNSVKNEALSNLSTLFEPYGIYMNIGNIREDGELPLLQAARDTQDERKLAETLLGQTDQEARGGTYTFTSKNGNGTAVFSDGGVFKVTFDAPVYGGGSSAKGAAKRLLRLMGIETVSINAEGNEGDETVKAVCAWKRQIIFNCMVTFVFKDGNLLEISGRRAANITALSGETDMSSCATALMSFLNAVKSERYSCTQIDDVQPGYYLKATGAGLSPVWRVETDGGGSVYFIDAATGDIVQDMR